jgi:hypothetical protein
MCTLYVLLIERTNHLLVLSTALTMRQPRKWYFAVLVLQLQVGAALHAMDASTQTAVTKEMHQNQEPAQTSPMPHPHTRNTHTSKL